MNTQTLDRLLEMIYSTLKAFKEKMTEFDNATNARINQIIDALNKTHIPRITALEKTAAEQKQTIETLKNRLNALDDSTFKKTGELESRIEQLESALKQKGAPVSALVQKQETEEISI